VNHFKWFFVKDKILPFFYILRKEDSLKFNILIKNCKMKKIVIILFMTFLSSAFLMVPTAEASIKKPDATAPAPKPEEKAEARVLVSRLNEINSLDKSKLSSSEKKNLRKEVKTIKSRLKDISGGIYISGAALIVIIILLIVLL
jgi:hypothetical protein